MRLLLGRYERPSLGRSDEARLVARLKERVAGGPSGTAPGILRFPSRRRILAATLSAAAAVVALAGGGLYLLSAASAGVPWTVADSGDAEPSAPGPRSRAAVVRVDGDAPIVLRSRNETIVLEPGAVLEVRGRFMHALTGDDSNVYTLSAGRALVDHRAGGFELVTPWASVVPTGTVVRAVVRPGEVRIGCEGGSVTIRPLDGGEGLRLGEGEAVTARLSEGLWTVYRHSASMLLADSVRRPSVDVSALPSPPSLSAEGDTRPIEASSVSGLSPVGEAPGIARASGRAATERGFSLVWSSAIGSGAAPAELALGSSAVYLYRASPDGDSITSAAKADGRPLGTATLGGAYAKRAFYGDRAFLLAGTTVSATDASTGALLWRGAAGPMGFAEFTVAEGRVYLPSADGTLYVLDASSGEVLRALTVGSGLYGKPLVAGGKIVFSAIDKALRAVDATDWSGEWQAAVPGGLLGDAPISLGALVIAQDSGGGLLAFNLADGSPAWSVRTGGSGTARVFGTAGGAIYERGSGAEMVSADGSTRTLPGVGGRILGSEPSGNLVTSSGIYRIGPDGVSEGPRVASALARVDGDDAYLLTDDGRLELWRWTER
jgi:outer membrane protein assembly factor BamB